MVIRRAAFILAAVLGLITHAAAQNPVPPEPMREFRGTWVATVFNLDWPSSSHTSASVQQAQLVAILDNAKRLKLNAVILQVRPNSDALYRSSMEPWSAWLTGSMGADPGYDPLAFAVAEAHRRGLQLHAWVNPFRALATTEGGMSERHISQRHPEWIRRFGTQLFIDPGVPEAREYVQRVILDIVRRYDVDGVHLDDYFYPYPAGSAEFPDGASYKKYSGGLARAEWRRQNIDRFISGLYSAIKSEKRTVLFGVSPFGIWRPGVPEGTTAGVDAYGSLACDAKLWLQKGWVDYLSPQLYWTSDSPGQSFTKLYDWWSEQNATGRHLWPGIATERIGAGRNAAEQARQINTIRRGRGDAGHIHWSNKSLMQNRGGIATALAKTTYATLALVPASPWLDRDKPSKPALVSKIQEGSHYVDWGESQSNVASYLVQWQTTTGWTSQIIGSTNTGVAWPSGSDVVRSVAVRTVSRTGILSDVAWLQR
ncbi:MAG: family 10 glycosylhydrolase [Chthoniobacterales bacterium]